MIRRLWRYRKTECILCGQKPWMVTMYFPPEKYQAAALPPPGCRYGAPFSLCRACAALPDAMQRVEQITLPPFVEMMVASPQRN